MTNFVGWAFEWKLKIWRRSVTTDCNVMCRVKGCVTVKLNTAKESSRVDTQWQRRLVCLSFPTVSFILLPLEFTCRNGRVSVCIAGEHTSLYLLPIWVPYCLILGTQIWTESVPYAQASYLWFCRIQINLLICQMFSTKRTDRPFVHTFRSYADNFT